MRERKALADKERATEKAMLEAQAREAAEREARRFSKLADSEKREKAAAAAELKRVAREVEVLRCNRVAAEEEADTLRLELEARNRGKEAPLFSARAEEDSGPEDLPPPPTITPAQLGQFLDVMKAQSAELAQLKGAVHAGFPGSTPASHPPPMPSSKGDRPPPAPRDFRGRKKGKGRGRCSGSPPSGKSSDSGGDSDRSVDLAGDAETSEDDELTKVMPDRGVFFDKNLKIPTFNGTDPAGAWMHTFEEMCEL